MSSLPDGPSTGPAERVLTRVAALYDIHGNLPALRAVLADVARARVDTLVIGGDVVPGPLPAETLEELMALRQRGRFVGGNGDREVVEAYDQGRVAVEAVGDASERANAFSASRISREQRDFLAGFAPTVVLDVEGLGPTLFCHGSPRSDTENITTATADDRLRGVLRGVDEPTVVCGHTHRLFDRRVDGWRVVNAGSVGIPYEGRAGAYWALLGPDVELRRTEYDLEPALEELRGGGFPDLDEMLQESLLTPFDPDEVAEFFERQATDAPE
jgi:predicted phosphodiesterase